MNNKLIFWMYCVLAMAVFAFGVAILKDVPVSDGTYTKLQSAATSANMPISDYTGGVIDTYISENEKETIIKAYMDREMLIRGNKERMQEAIICFDNILRT